MGRDSFTKTLLTHSITCLLRNVSRTAHDSFKGFYYHSTYNNNNSNPIKKEKMEGSKEKKKKIW